MGSDIFRIQDQNSRSRRQSVSRPNVKFDLTDELNINSDANTSQFNLKAKAMIGFKAVVIGVLLVFVFRLVYLQIIYGYDYAKKSEANRVRTEVLEAPRGIFYDRNGNQLVKNQPIFYLAYSPSDLPAEQILNNQLEIISKFTEYSQEDLRQVIYNNPKFSYQSLPLIDVLTYDEVIKLKTNLLNWTGFELGIRGARNYNYGSIISHILGYLGRISPEEFNSPAYAGYRLTDYVGKSGLEMQYESYLRGVDGKKQVEIDARGKIQKVVEEISPISGNNIILTIDIDIQKKLYELLNNQLKNNNLKKGAAIALNPQNGEILAAVSLPAYDNNIFSGKVSYDDYQQLADNPDQPLFFRPFQGEYPSGSIFKPLVALAALDKGIIDKNTTVFSQGGIRIHSWFFPDWKAGGHGVTNLKKAIAESVNTYFFAIGGGYGNIEGLGIENITNFAKKLFFTKKLNVDFPSESTGFLPSKEWKKSVKNEKWYIGDTYNVSIGQGDVLITPLQITSFMSYLANGGVLYQPYFVKQIEGPDNKIDKIDSKIITTDITSQANIAAVREGLRATVEWGSARSLSTLKPFLIAGKTGTAQLGGDQAPHAWFTSFAPYKNPTIALTILVENGIGGSENAVPVAREFYKWYKDKY